MPAELFQRYRVVERRHAPLRAARFMDVTSVDEVGWRRPTHRERARGTDLWMADKDNFLNSPGNTAIAGWPGLRAGRHQNLRGDPPVGL